jgi:hypothetical protein
MPNPILESLKAPVMMSFNLFEKFLDACPDDFWESEWAGFKVWQQFYHALNVVERAVPPDMKEPLCEGVPRDVASLKAMGTDPISKEKAKECLIAAKKHMEVYIATLSDATLPGVNQKVSALMNSDSSNFETLVTIAGHNEYHLGIFDAGLRERKLPGIF